MVLVLSFFLGLGMALEYSMRMQALGTEFAYLIPDYETDLYLNPNLLGEKLTSVTVEPRALLPLAFRALRSRFGYGGKMGGSSEHYRDMSEHEWSETDVAYRDFWFVDLRGCLPRFLASDVWNIYNDAVFYTHYDLWNTSAYDSTTKIEYLGVTKEATPLGENWNLIYQVGAGPYYYNKRAGGGQIRDAYRQWILISSGRVGLYYRNAGYGDKLTSLYIDIGGPISRAEINSLPYSVYLSVPRESGTWPRVFARALTPRIGFASSISYGPGFLALGVCDRVVLQKTENLQANWPLQAVENKLALLAALEWTFNRLFLRVGTAFAYEMSFRREGKGSSMARYDDHRLSLRNSFGLGWRPADNLTIDLVNSGDLSYIGSWAITIGLEQ